MKKDIMNITELKNRQDISTDTKSVRIYSQFEQILNELRERKLSQNFVTLTNNSVEQINSSTLTETQFTKFIKEKQTAILKQAEKEFKIVPKNYYRNMWMLFGMSGIGVPIGVAFGLSIGNLGLLGLGLPIGMAIGLAIGSLLDKKALNERRQLNIEIKN